LAAEELIKNRLIQKDHINRAHEIINMCFEDEIDNSGQAYIQKFMQPKMNEIIHKQKHIVKATSEYFEQV